MRERPVAGERMRSAADWFASGPAARPRLAVVLGSGLSGALQVHHATLVAGFEEIPGFIETGVAGHPGRLIAGRLHGVDVIVFEGRVHLYEGRGPETLETVPAFSAAVGADSVLLTSACGGIAPHLEVGDFVVVRDHLLYPLGGSVRRLGRATGGFPGRVRALAGDGTEAVEARGRFRPTKGPYSAELAGVLERACLECGAPWRRGVLAFSAGPCYESPAEARLLCKTGADVVSMSAGAEALSSWIGGLEVASLCCVTNLVGLWSRRHGSHEDVLREATKAKDTMSAVLDRFVRLIARRGPGHE